MADELSQFISTLLEDPEKESIGAELSALQSIYGEEGIEVWKGNGSGNGQTTPSIRYQVTVNLPDHEDVFVRFLVSLPESYPESSPPQLQMLSKYVGDLQVDSLLFGSVLRTFISCDGVQWSAGEVCVFDGLENATFRCSVWYKERLSEKMAAAIQRDEEQKAKQESRAREDDSRVSHPIETEPVQKQAPKPDFKVLIHEAAPIIDRKSVFVGRACRIENPSEVGLILEQLVREPKIAKAAHPIICAWRCEVNDVVHADNDDNGETAAGGRLAHLLQILDVMDVLVIVTRYFGGIHLGPDRFKHINQAARDALEVGGFLDDQDSHKDLGSRDKKRTQARSRHAK